MRHELTDAQWAAVLTYCDECGRADAEAFARFVRDLLDYRRADNPHTDLTAPSWRLTIVCTAVEDALVAQALTPTIRDIS